MSSGSAEIALNGCDGGYKQLCSTIKEGRVDEALHLIAIGAEVKQQKRLQHTPLHHAVCQSSQALISLLLSKGSNVNAKGHNNKTPLHLAKSGEIAKFLLNNGASMDAVTLKEGYSPLHQAIVDRQSAVVEVLLEGGADVNYLNKNGETALSLAVSKKCICIVDLVLKYNPDVSIPRNRDCLNNAAELGIFDGYVSQALIEYGIGVNPSDTNVFLRAAAWSGCWNIVQQLLLKHEEGCLKSYEFVLYHSIKRNVPHITDIMLSRQVDISVVNNDENFPALCAAVLRLDVEITKKLIAKGADVNKVSAYGETALHYCAIHIDRAMDVSKKVQDASREKIAELFISHGANVNARTNDARQFTPLHFVVDNGYHTVVQVLLKAKADVNAKDTIGRTPLYFAVVRYNLQIAEILLSNGADVNLVNNDKKTALDLICDDFKFHGSTKSWQKMAKLLTSHETLTRAQELIVNDVRLHDQEAIKELRLACENELAKLKIEKIGTSFLSFYNVLTQSEVSFAKCLIANKEIVKILKSRATKTMFPIYESYLKKKLKTGLVRNKLIEQACENPFRLLPENCWQKIQDYLNDADLKMLGETSS